MPCYIILFYSISSSPTLTVAFEFEFVDCTSFGSHIWFYNSSAILLSLSIQTLIMIIEYEYSMPYDMWILSLCVCLYASLALPPFQNISFVSILNLFQNFVCLPKKHLVLFFQIHTNTPFGANISLEHL